MKILCALSVAATTCVGLARTALAQIPGIPCPVEREIKEARAQNERQGSNQPVSFYQGLAENYRGQCERAYEEMRELYPKLKEYEEGKRDERDGYIILNKLHFQFGVLRAIGTPEAQQIRAKLDALLKKKPDYPNMQDFRLSEEIAADERKRQAKVKETAEATKWIPEDTEVMGFFASTNQVAVPYQYRIEFFTVPNTEFFQAHDSAWLTRDTRTSTAPPKPLVVPRKDPTRILTFKTNVIVYPRNTQKNRGPHLLVCTRREGYYNPITPEQREIVRRRGFSYGMPWVNEHGAIGNFCGVLNMSGETLFEFPKPMGDDVLVPLDIVESGTRAAVLVGTGTKETGEDEEGIGGVGNFSEIMVWQYPDKIKHVQLPESNRPDYFWLQKFIDHEF